MRNFIGKEFSWKAELYRGVNMVNSVDLDFMLPYTILIV